MDRIERERLERRLARAIEIGDRLAAAVLRARLAPRRQPDPEMSELEKRYAWGDR